MTFLDVWVAYALFGVTVYSIAFVWAVRNRQFMDLDRGRYLALDDEPASEEEPLEPRRLDRWFLAAMVCIAAVLLLAAVVVGWGDR